MKLSRWVRLMLRHTCGASRTSIRMHYIAWIMRSAAHWAHIWVLSCHVKLRRVRLVKAIIDDLSTCMSHSCLEDRSLIEVRAVIPFVHRLCPSIVWLHCILIVIRDCIHSISHWIVSVKYPHWCVIIHDLIYVSCSSLMGPHNIKTLIIVRLYSLAWRFFFGSRALHMISWRWVVFHRSL